MDCVLVLFSLVFFIIINTIRLIPIYYLDDIVHGFSPACLAMLSSIFLLPVPFFPRRLLENKEEKTKDRKNGLS